MRERLIELAQVREDAQPIRDFVLKHVFRIQQSGDAQLPFSNTEREFVIFEDVPFVQSVKIAEK